MRPDFYTYPAFFYYENEQIGIVFPDLPGCVSCAENNEEAFRCAREALGLHLFGMEEDGDEIPAASEVQCLKPEGNGILVLVQVYMPPVRESVQLRYVKKTLSIPAWLNAVALENNVNFSQVLQNALMEQLHVRAPRA